MGNKIARVFPRKTNMAPDDPMVFFGYPTIEALTMDIEAVHSTALSIRGGLNEDKL